MPIRQALAGFYSDSLESVKVEAPEDSRMSL